MKFVKRSIAITSIVICGGLIAGSIFMFNSVRAVEPLVDRIGEKIKEYNSKPSIIYSANHVKLYEVYPIYSEPVEVSALPKHVIQAVLAAEDKRFYDHPGVDYMGFGRVLKKLVSGSDNSGGTAPVAVALTKRMLWANAGEPDPAAAEALDGAVFRWTTQSPDAREGIRAFMEKRAPQWQMKASSDLPALEGFRKKPS